MNFQSLLQDPLWSETAYPEGGALIDKARVSYQRARRLIRHVNMTARDITELRPKFWALNLEYILTFDTAMATIIIVHWNLVMGTIASHAAGRPELQAILSELQAFDSCGEFLLTEVDHGLDARNLQTTATLNLDGSFDLHTPHPGAAKSMPPTAPNIGIPKLAVVFAQLVVKDERRGVRPFIVRLSDGTNLRPGITSHLLPPRVGARPIDHSITEFHHVRLEASALLGSWEKPADERAGFLQHIHRVTYGTLGVATLNIPCLRLSGYIVGRYSQKRTVAGASAEEGIPLIAFPTQYIPVLKALTFSSVMHALATEAVEAVTNASDDPVMQNAIACVFKQFAQHSTQTIANELVDRCGWRGLFGHNQVVEMMSALRGNSIAEGDILVLCIRLASEILIGRSELPEALDPTSLLARYEAGVWKEAAADVADIQAQGLDHRSDAFSLRILPRAKELIHAIGQRMAYETACASAQVSEKSIWFYEACCVMEHASWFAENGILSRAEMRRGFEEAAARLLPDLDMMLDKTGAEPWATAPMLSEDNWKRYVEGLPTFENDDVAAQKEGTVTEPTSMIAMSVQEQLQARL